MSSATKTRTRPSTRKSTKKSTRKSTRKATKKNARKAAKPAAAAKKSTPMSVTPEEKLALQVELILRDCCCTLSQDSRKILEHLKTNYYNKINAVLPEMITDLKQRDTLLDVSREVSRKIVSGEGTSECCTPDRLQRVARKFEELLDQCLLDNHHRFLNDALRKGTLQLGPAGREVPLTPKFEKLINAVLDNNYYFMQSYYHRALSSVLKNLNSTRGRKTQEKVRRKKTEIFELNSFPEKMIEYYLDRETISYEELKDLHEYAKKVGVSLVPRDIGRARKSIVAARTSILRRAGGMTPAKKKNLERLLHAGFSQDLAQKIADNPRLTSVDKMLKTYAQACVQTDKNVHLFRVSSNSRAFKKALQSEFVRYLNGTHYYLFNRNRLTSLLKDLNADYIRGELNRIFKRKVESERFLKRLTTMRTFRKMKLFQYDGIQRKNGVPISSVTRLNKDEYEVKVGEVFDHLLETYQLTLPEKELRAAFEAEQKAEKDAAIAPERTFEEEMVFRLLFILDEGLAPDQKMVDGGWLQPGTNLRAKILQQRSRLEKKVTSFTNRVFRLESYRERFKRNPKRLVGYLHKHIDDLSRLEKGFLLQQIYVGAQEGTPSSRIYRDVIEHFDTLEPSISNSDRKDAFLKAVYELPAMDQQAREFYFRNARLRLLAGLGRKRTA